MVRKVEVYVEGGGDSKDVKIRCREGFHKLLDRTGLKRKPRFIPCGGREAVFDKFKTALRAKDAHPVLLVDSEDVLKSPDINAWEHLQSRDAWMRPEGVLNDQAQLMVTCMETWIMADQDALHAFYGAALNKNALLPAYELESRERHVVQQTLENATRSCGNDKMYRKGKRSFRILGELNPAVLEKHLPHFAHLVATLAKLLNN